MLERGGFVFLHNLYYFPEIHSTLFKIPRPYSRQYSQYWEYKIINKKQYMAYALMPLVAYTLCALDKIN